MFFLHWIAEVHLVQILFFTFSISDSDIFYKIICTFKTDFENENVILKTPAIKTERIKQMRCTNARQSSNAKKKRYFEMSKCKQDI